MPIFAKDLFAGAAGTNLNAHTPDIGTAWTYNSGSGMLRNGGGGAYASTTGFKLLNIDGTPPLNDYFVQATINVKTVISTDVFGLSARLPNSGLASGIYALYDRTNAWYIIIENGGSNTSSASAAPADGAVFQLQVLGNQATLRVDGVVKCGPFTMASSPSGRAGICIQTSGVADTTTTGTHLTDFSAFIKDIPYVKTDQLAYMRI